MIKMVVVLTVIACGASLLIAFTNSKTADRIEQQRRIAQQEALRVIMPEGVTVEERSVKPTGQRDPLEYWIATAETDTFYAFKMAARGYSSTITCMVCVTGEGTIVGMTVLEQNETPGLGSRLQEVISKKYIWNGLLSPKENIAPWFAAQFDGISINRPIVIDKGCGEWHKLDSEERRLLIDKNGITAITGATISTRAVTTGLSTRAQEYLKAIREQ